MTTTTKTLVDYQDEIFTINNANGWFTLDRPFDDDVALLHSEVSEAYEAFRDWGLDDMTEALCGYGYADHGSPDHPGLCKPQGVGNELADVLVRLLDTAFRYNAGFEWEGLAEVESHPEFYDNVSFGAHIRKLHDLIARLELGADGELLTPLSPTLSYLATTASHYGFDLEAELVRKLAFNRTRGFRHGGKRV